VLLARDSMKSFQELTDEALHVLLKEHNRPVTLREALTASTRAIPANDTPPPSARGRSRKEKK
jgi:hypothetical protein